MALFLKGRPGSGFRETSLFLPRSVLLRGDPALAESRILARNLLGGGFQGKLMAEGFEGFETPEGAPDLAILCVRPDAQAEALRDIAAMGCRVAIVPTPAPGLAAMAEAAGVRALGESSFGLALPNIGLNATLAHLRVPKGRLALIAQSSAIARAVIDWAVAEGLGFSHIIGIGSNEDLGFAMGLDWLARDSATACVLLELRRIKQRRRFVSAARAAARTRPVLALRPGGRMDDPSGLVDAVMGAVLRRAGILRANGFEDWLAAAETLARTKPRAGAGGGNRVAILANGLGMARLAADAAVGLRLNLVELSEDTRAALAPLLAGQEVRNPLTLGAAGGTGLAEAAKLLAAAREVDVVMALHAPEEPEEEAPSTQAFVAAARGNRGAPILLGWTGEASAHGERAALTEAGLPVFDSPEAVARGAAYLAAERHNRAAAAELPASDVLAFEPDRAAVRALFAGARAEGRHRLLEDEALQVLAAYGLEGLPTLVATTPARAAGTAVGMGFPVVLKVRGLLCHKSEVGGIALNLRDGAAVTAAAEAMAEEVPRRAPGALLQGFLVQHQAPRGMMELRLRVGEDAMFGPWIGFGRGSSAADIAEDEAFDLPPLNLPLAHAMIARTRLSRLLHGFRERPPVNEPAIADAAVRISQLVVDFPEIAMLTVNPLFADARGVLVGDAAITLRPEGEAAQLAIPPYPAGLAAPFTASDGKVYEVRPIRPEDAAAHGEHFRSLPPEDVRFRFFSVMRELPPAMVARLTQIDYDREMAFVAARSGQILGTARIIRQGEDSAEFAVVVSPSAKGTGLARHLMERAIGWARDTGIAELVGLILADNKPMLAFAQHLGFTLHRSEEDQDIMEARMRLD